MTLPTFAQYRMLDAINRGDRALAFVTVRESTRTACRIAGWIRRDDLGGYDLTDMGRDALAQMRRQMHPTTPDHNTALWATTSKAV